MVTLSTSWGSATKEKTDKSPKSFIFFINTSSFLSKTFDNSSHVRFAYKGLLSSFRILNWRICFTTRWSFKWIVNRNSEFTNLEELYFMSLNLLITKLVIYWLSYLFIQIFKYLMDEKLFNKYNFIKPKKRLKLQQYITEQKRLDFFLFLKTYLRKWLNDSKTIYIQT